MLLERPNAIKEILHGSITARLIERGFLGGPPLTHEISPKINFDKREIICILYFFPWSDRGAAEGEVRQRARGAAEEEEGQEDAALKVICYMKQDI